MNRQQHRVRDQLTLQHCQPWSTTPPHPVGSWCLLLGWSSSATSHPVPHPQPHPHPLRHIPPATRGSPRDRHIRSKRLKPNISHRHFDPVARAQPPAFLSLFSSRCRVDAPHHCYFLSHFCSSLQHRLPVCPRAITPTSITSRGRQPILAMDPTKAQTTATFAHLKSQKANKVSRRSRSGAARRGDQWSEEERREGKRGSIKGVGVWSEERAVVLAAGLAIGSPMHERAAGREPRCRPRRVETRRGGRGVESVFRRDVWAPMGKRTSREFTEGGDREAKEETRHSDTAAKMISESRSEQPPDSDPDSDSRSRSRSHSLLPCPH